MVASPTSRSEPPTSRTRHSSQEVKPATGQDPCWIQGMPLAALRFMSKRGGNCVWRATCNNLGRGGIRNREGRTTSETIQFEKNGLSENEDVDLRHDALNVCLNSPCTPSKQQRTAGAKGKVLNDRRKSNGGRHTLNVAAMDASPWWVKQRDSCQRQ